MSGEPSVAAFYARTVTTETTHVDNQRIIFGNVITNDLFAYDGTTGIFTAPSTGTYVFSATLATEIADSYVEGYIAVNGQEQGWVYCPAISNGSKMRSGSGLFVLRLNTNDRVWMQIDKNHFTQGMAFYPFETAFAGFMLN